MENCHRLAVDSYGKMCVFPFSESSCFAINIKIVFDATGVSKTMDITRYSVFSQTDWTYLLTHFVRVVVCVSFVSKRISISLFTRLVCAAHLFDGPCKELNADEAMSFLIRLISAWAHSTTALTSSRQCNGTHEACTHSFWLKNFVFCKTDSLHNLDRTCTTANKKVLFRSSRSCQRNTKSNLFELGLTTACFHSLILCYSADSLRFGVSVESNRQFQAFRVNRSRLQANRTDVADFVASAVEYRYTRHSAAATATSTIVAYAQREERRDGKFDVETAAAAATAQVSLQTQTCMPESYALKYISLFVDLLFCLVWPHRRLRKGLAVFAAAAPSFHGQSPNVSIPVQLDMVLRTSIYRMLSPESPTDPVHARIHFWMGHCQFPRIQIRMQQQFMSSKMN